jgi:hypothetical protein
MDRALPGASFRVLRKRCLFAAVRFDMNSTDVQLLSRIAAGDQQAFGEFYDRYCSLVLGLLVNLFSAVYVSRTIFMLVLSRRRRSESLSI